jgi:hypothetical protein
MVSSVDGLPVPLRSVRRVPLASRSCVGGGNGALVEQALDFTPDEQASQPPDIALA